nr:hypothetical protein [Tanacetum cinerariifolium]
GVNSHAKIPSHKTRDSNKPVDHQSHTQTPGRQIFTGNKFSSNKNFAVYKKTSPRSDLRWKPTGRIFKSIGFRWLPTGKTMALEHGSLIPGHNFQENVSHRDKTGTTSNELDLLFSPMFDELLNGSSKVVSQSSAVVAADAPNLCQQPTTPLNIHTTPVPTCQNPPITTSVI